MLRRWLSYCDYWNYFERCINYIKYNIQQQNITIRSTVAHFYHIIVNYLVYKYIITSILVINIGKHHFCRVQVWKNRKWAQLSLYNSKTRENEIFSSKNKCNFGIERRYSALTTIIIKMASTVKIHVWLMAPSLLLCLSFSF